MVYNQRINPDINILENITSPLSSNSLQQPAQTQAQKKQNLAILTQVKKHGHNRRELISDHRQSDVPINTASSLVQGDIASSQNEIHLDSQLLHVADSKNSKESHANSNAQLTSEKALSNEIIDLKTESMAVNSMSNLDNFVSIKEIRTVHKEKK